MRSRAELRSQIKQIIDYRHKTTIDSRPRTDAVVGIGQRIPETGFYKVLYSNGVSHTGNKIFTGDHYDGQSTRSTQAAGSDVVTLDGPPASRIKQVEARKDAASGTSKALPWYLETWKTKSYTIFGQTSPSFTDFNIQLIPTGQKTKPQLVRQYTYTGQNSIFVIVASILEFKLESGTILSSYNTDVMPFVYNRLLSGTATQVTTSIITNWRLVHAPDKYWEKKQNYAPSPP